MAWPKGSLAYKKDFVTTHLKGRIVIFNASLAKVIGINATLFLQQCTYWSGRTPRDDGWFYKTTNSMKEETCLSRYQQERALKKLADLKIIQHFIAGIPPVRYLRVDFDRLFEFIDEILAEQEDLEIKIRGDKIESLRRRILPPVTKNE